MNISYGIFMFVMGAMAGGGIIYAIIGHIHENRMHVMRRLRDGAHDVASAYRRELSASRDLTMSYLRVIAAQNALLTIHGYAPVELGAPTDTAQEPVLPPLPMKNA